jgi:Zn-finger nucleic acid-binding protein
MKCPVCTTVNLVMSERQGVEIDYCPDCRGVWLDRGELDKILQRAAQQDAPTAAPQQAPQPQQQPQQPQYVSQPQQQYAQQQQQYAQQQYGQQQNQYGQGGQGQYHGQKPYKKKSFLEELFD